MERDGSLKLYGENKEKVIREQNERRMIRPWENGKRDTETKENAVGGKRGEQGSRESVNEKVGGKRIYIR